MSAKNVGENDLWEKSPVHSADTLGSKIVKIAVFRTISEINGFLHFMQKLKMSAQKAGKIIFGKNHL